MGKPTTARRTPLSRERVLRAAVAFADEHGVETLSMRKLADELGVQAMSLYNHVANKEDLLDGILDSALAEIARPRPDGDWRTQIREVAVSAHETMLSHPWATELSVRAKPGPARFHYGESLLGCLRNAGFSKELTFHAYHIVESYIQGFTALILNYRAVDPEVVQAVVDRFLHGDFAEDFPHFTEHARQHMEPEPGQDDVNAFELGLGLLLDGLERLRDEGFLSPANDIA
jgi:AcrR family transcriptional regulator